jgi:DoxX-like family
VEAEKGSLQENMEGNQMSSATEIRSQSKSALWTGRIISGLVVLFMVFDGVTKLMRVEPVLKAAAQLGFSVHQIVGIGIVLLICTLVYVVPRTSILGAILLTGYLGGAVAIQVRAGNPLFETLFPVIFGVLTWAGLFMRDHRLREMVPVRLYRQAD